MLTPATTAIAKKRSLNAASGSANVLSIREGYYVLLLVANSLNRQAALR